MTDYSADAINSLARAIDHHSAAIRSLLDLHQSNGGSHLKDRLNAIEGRLDRASVNPIASVRIGLRDSDVVPAAAQDLSDIGRGVSVEGDGEGTDPVPDRVVLDFERFPNAGSGFAAAAGAQLKVGEDLAIGGLAHDDSSTSGGAGTPLDHTVGAPGRPGDDFSPDALEGAAAPWCAWCHDRRASRLVKAGPAWAVCEPCAERRELLVGSREEFVITHPKVDPNDEDCCMEGLSSLVDAEKAAHRGERIWRRVVTAWREVA
ncbi:hypothetical protein [Micropruina sp.]|uniref:hypothetical protein n=1 Tax=Micropruina sp. TaxID=2737536 RepID=UPI0039E41FD1